MGDDEPTISYDFYPTFVAAAKGELPSNQTIDGVSLLPLFSNPSQTLQRAALHWHYPHYHGSTWTPGAAIRSGDWKAIQFYHHDKAELYNLSSDLGETYDLAKSRPEKLQELLEKLKELQKQSKAILPKPNA